VQKSALAGAFTGGVLFLVFFLGAEAWGYLGQDLFKGLWGIGLCWSLVIGALAGALAAGLFNLLRLAGRIWPVAEAEARPI
jgi:hypothetical protein